MEIVLKKNEAAYITFPMVTTASPDTFDTGETVTDTGYYKDGAGAWTTLAITDTVSEIGTTGVYSIDLTAGEMNHDLIMLKFTSTNAADTMVMIRTYAVDVDDLVRATTPANTLDVSATGEAGVDWANVGSPTSSVGLTATTVSINGTLQKLDDLENVSAATVNAQVADVMKTDTYSTESLTGAPPVAPTMEQAISYLYKSLRNKKTATSTQISIYDDAGSTVDHKRTISDNGTTYTEEEIVTGP